MKIQEYRKLRESLVDDAFEVSNKKGEDYTQKSDDALKNFKAVAERTGLTPYQVLGVYMMKHQDAIASFIEHGGQLESEPIKERIIDNINYLCLLWGLITEEEQLLTDIFDNEQRERTTDEETVKEKDERERVDRRRLRENGEIRESEGFIQSFRSSRHQGDQSKIHPGQDESSRNTGSVQEMG